MTRLLTSALALGLILTLAVPAAGERVGLDFEHPTWDEQPDQTLTEAIDALREVHPFLVDVRGLDMTRTRRTRGMIGRGLEISLPPGAFRGFGPYSRLSQRVDEAWFRYYVLLSNFRPVSSGKLPGLADASGTPSAKGCIPSTEANPGWSARMMFDTVGTRGAGPGEVPVGYYVYHLDQAGSCGDEWIFTQALQARRWTCIEGHVRMNRPGAADGLIQAWMDGERVFWQDGLAFRRPGENLGVREMWNNVYFGGRYPTPNQLGLVLDEVVTSTTGRIGCIDPFVDDNDSIHADDLTEAYARQILFGCAEGRVCPHANLTRGEFAAMIHRVVRTPSGPDVFADDNGHFAEQAINSLARAGILRGCNPPANTRVCPDSPVTRAEVAAMVKRLLDLPAGPNAFTDDDGHWAEADINAVAAADITRGCGEHAYCPERRMTRAEAATFTLRIHDRLSAVTTLSAPDIDWPPAGPPPPKPLEEQE